MILIICNISQVYYINGERKDPPYRLPELQQRLLALASEGSSHALESVYIHVDPRHDKIKKLDQRQNHTKEKLAEAHTPETPRHAHGAKHKERTPTNAPVWKCSRPSSPIINPAIPLVKAWEGRLEHVCAFACVSMRASVCA